MYLLLNVGISVMVAGMFSSSFSHFIDLAVALWIYYPGRFILEKTTFLQKTKSFLPSYWSYTSWNGMGEREIKHFCNQQIWESPSVLLDHCHVDYILTRPVSGCNRFLVNPGGWNDFSSGNLKRQQRRRKKQISCVAYTQTTIHHQLSPVCLWSFSVFGIRRRAGCMCLCYCWMVVLVWESQCRLENDCF